MNTTLEESEALRKVDGSEHDCPYCNTGSGVCSASLSRMAIDAKRRSGYCSSENYDCCPIFLARTLRGIPRKSKTF